jgi:4-hydroxythreonine-4-phosphate dehydrogenase
MTPAQDIRVGISIGDIAGIGAEIIIKALQDPSILEGCIPIIYAGDRLMIDTADTLGVRSFSFRSIQGISQIESGRINLMQVWQGDTGHAVGTPSPDSGKYALMSLEHAATDLHNGDIDALVTAPIDKHNIQTDRFKFPGHTEYLASLAGTSDFLMLLVSGALRVGVVTGHIPVRLIAENLSTMTIVNKLQVIHKSLKKDFAIDVPKIAVLGLNPHAGDKGLIGTEEKDIIIPAIDEVRTSGIDAKGPFPADGFFGSSQYKEFDAILAMYHDQGLVPFKALSFGSGVNFTAGLPFVRTSPDHGTAYDIAGKGVAEEASFKEALYTAIDIVQKRRSALY